VSRRGRRRAPSVRSSPQPAARRLPSRLGTSDEKLAAKDPKRGRPVDSPLRRLWVTETALSTALNTASFAGSVSTSVIVMGFALLLVGAGFLVLALMRCAVPRPPPRASGDRKSVV
jgi:hypothetical protein